MLFGCQLEGDMPFDLVDLSTVCIPNYRHSRPAKFCSLPLMLKKPSQSQKPYKDRAVPLRAPLTHISSAPRGQDCATSALGHGVDYSGELKPRYHLARIVLQTICHPRDGEIRVHHDRPWNSRGRFVSPSKSCPAVIPPSPHHTNEATGKKVNKEKGVRNGISFPGHLASQMRACHAS